MKRWSARAVLQARLRAFWNSRLKPQDSVLLTQRNVYILPTRAGWMLALTLLVLLLTSINFQLNLGYLLTFLLAGCSLAGIHVCHANLSGVRLQMGPLEPVFQGSAARLPVTLLSSRNTPRHGIALAVQKSDQDGHPDSQQWVWCDLPALGSTQISLATTPQQRGWVAPPLITAETRYPLGSFRVWTVWRPAAQLLVYPAPEASPPPLPAGRSSSGDGYAAARQQSDEFDGARPWRHGDPLRHVLWKKFAKNGTLVSRDSEPARAGILWLDFAHCGGGGNASAPASGTEQRLSRLCAWVLMADHQQLEYGLRLPGLSLPPASGAAHKLACLQALALY